MNTDTKHSDQDGIAEVFASFYEKLYTGRKIVKGPDTARTQLQPFTQKELTDALGKMSKGKAADDSGIVAEMLKQGNRALLDAILFCSMTLWWEAKEFQASGR